MAAVASLALTIGGGLIGGPIGSLVGSLLGSLLFPQKVDGPRLSDLHLHTSSYGGMTPILYGTMRVAGNIDWQTDLTEHEDTSGGKGGPEVTTYTYSASFGVTLCEGPIAGIGKIWANSRKIYDRLNPVANQEDLPFTVYLGTEDQLPDPTMQAHLGANNVPAYRGLARVVFTDWMLTDYSNTIPSLNFEVYTSAGAIPQRISTFSPGQYSPSGNLDSVTYDATTGVITVGAYYSGSGDGHPEMSYQEHYFDLDGTEVGTPVVDLALPSGLILVDMIASNVNLATAHNNGGTTYMWLSHGVQVGLTLDPDEVPDMPYGKGVAQNGYLFCQAGSVGEYIQRWTLGDDGVPTGMTPDLQVSSPAGSDISFGTSDVGKIYVHQGTTGNFWEYDEDLSLTDSWTSSDFPSGITVGAINGNNFVRYSDFFVFSYSGLSSETLNLVSISSSGTLSLYPQARTVSDLPEYGFVVGPVITLSGGDVIGLDGVTRLNPEANAVALADIVADLSRRAGLDDSQFDTSGLPDTVRGYLISQQQSVREDISPLRQAYFFDGVEVDDKVVFVKRGGDSVVTIPDDDLAAYADGDTPPPILATDRAPEVDLPAQVTVNFVNAEADYETGTQQAQRQTTQSQSTVTIDLPISLTNEETKAIAQKHLAGTWLERDSHSILVPRKYAKYVPTDVITAHGVTLHIRDKSESASGVIKLDGVPSLSGIFLQAPKAAAGSGFTPATPGTGSSSTTTTAALFDLPLAKDTDAAAGYYLGMDGATGWSGAALYESVDGGTTYSSVFSESSAQVLGTTNDALLPFTGGNVFDESNTVTVVTDGGELTSATADAVLNGANLAVIGSEYIQFKNATLTATNTYVLSGLLRGRRGTEWAMDHAIGDRFMLMSSAARIVQSDFNVTRQYKPVTFGATVASATAQPFVNTGASLKPYAPVQLGGGTDASGNVTLNWTRRTRIGGAWSPFVDVPLSETSEAYVVQIWNADYTQCARIIEGVTSLTTTYTSAQQVTDFGANQQTIYFTVGQVGSVGLGYQARGTAGGAGSSDNDPLSPVSPYHSDTSGSPAPPSVPQLTLSMGWANVRKLSSSVGTFNCSNVLVASFTTPASSANGAIGWISAVEWIDPAVFRVACLSTVAGDFSGTALSRVVSKDPTCFFSVGTNPDGYPELSPSTTYYFNVKNDDGNGACTCLSGSCGVAVELTKPTGL